MSVVMVPPAPVVQLLKQVYVAVLQNWVASGQEQNTCWPQLSLM